MKKGPGRPPLEGERGHRRTFRMTDALYAQAGKIGGGNATEGIKRAIRAYLSADNSVMTEPQDDSVMTQSSTQGKDNSVMTEPQDKDCVEFLKEVLTLPQAKRLERIHRQLQKELEREKKELYRLRLRQEVRLEEKHQAKLAEFYQLQGTVDLLMTQEEFDRIRRLCHPDRHPEERHAICTKAMHTLERIEALVDAHAPIAELRLRGWEKKSVRYRKPRKKKG